MYVVSLTVARPIVGDEVRDVDVRDADDVAPILDRDAAVPGEAVHVRAEPVVARVERVAEPRSSCSRPAFEPFG
jgi:hypothetical protein